MYNNFYKILIEFFLIKKLNDENDSALIRETMHFSSDVVVCSSSNNIVKSFETYLQLMDILRPISLDVFMGLTQIIDYYVSFLKYSILFN